MSVTIQIQIIFSFILSFIHSIPQKRLKKVKRLPVLVKIDFQNWNKHFKKNILHNSRHRL